MTALVNAAHSTTDTDYATLQGQTGTVDTGGHGSGEAFTVNKPGTNDDWDLGTDTSAAGANPELRPDLSPLPDGYQAGPAHTSAIF